MTDAIDISVGDHKLVLDLLKQHLPNVVVWAYGSRVKWTARPQSDLDLVAFASCEQKAAVFNLREALEESSLPFPVDLFIWDELPESFRKRIEAEHVVLVEGEDGAGSEWRETSLGEVIELKRGYDLPQHKRVPGSVPLVSSSGVSDYHEEAKVKGPGVVTGRYGTLGQVFFVPDDFWPLNTTLYVRQFKGNDPRFISYFLRELDFFAYSDKAAVPGLNRNHLHQATVRYPTDVTEQRAIAHILGTLDDKIELNRRMNETLEEMARALFKSWFVDFDPVRAKMEGRDTGLPPDVADLFPDRLVESELGEIPEGWIAGNLGSYVEFQNGYAFKSIDWQNNGVPVVKIGSVKPGLVDLRATSCVSPETVVDLERFKLNPGDILVGMTGYPGETGLVPIHDPHPYLNQRVGRISAPQDHPENYAWIYAQVRNKSFKRHAEARAHGSAQANVSGRALLEYPVVFPGKALLKHYSDFATPLISRYLTNDAESRMIANLRDALLPKLVSGELRVVESMGREGLYHYS